MEPRPDLLGHMRHDRMENSKQPLERSERRGKSIRILCDEPRLDRLRIPVAEVVEGEAIERGGRGCEIELPERALQELPRLVEAREDPALLSRARPGLRLDPLRAGEHDAVRHVPELDRELPALLDLTLVETHVLRGGHLHQPVARRVRAEAADRIERVDAGAEALRHSPPVRREHDRVDDHVAERHLAHELEAGEDHTVLPEADDVAGRDVEVAGIEAAQVGRVVRPAESRERPEG